MSVINLVIDGIAVTGLAGDTILKIAKENGFHIPTLCHDESLTHYGACGICVVEVEGSPKLLRACSTVATDGMQIYTESAKVIQSRKILLELLMSDHEGDCVGPCSLACPARVDCQGYVKQIALGNDTEAVRILKQKLPLPASIGRVCPHPCEDACRRELVEEPISIAYLKYFAADRDLASGTPYRPQCELSTGKSVGIIGGGPAGLTAAYYLAQKGHAVTIYDAMPQMGGMLRYGIPEYRLPKKVLDQEIAEITALGVEMKNNVKIGKDISFQNISRSHGATLVAIGAWKSSEVGCSGDTLEGVIGGIDFLREVSMGNAPDIGQRVVVVGGGNTAMDACRTAVRLGAKEVYVVYRRTLAEMPASKLEVTEAQEEGVVFKLLRNPDEIIADENGRAKTVKLQVMKLGEPDNSGRRAPIPIKGEFEYLNVDTIIAAIGQKADMLGFEGINLNRKGIIAADEATFRTSMEGVFAVGDATNHGAGIAIEAIGEANKAAEIIHQYLYGKVALYRKPFVSEREVTEKDFEERDRLPRMRMPHRAPSVRKHDFGEVNLGLLEELARVEAKRCLECGCHDYEDCKLICHANQYTIYPELFAGPKHPSFTEKRLVSIERNQGKCILCGLCVRTCEQVAGKGILGLVGRGFETVIKPEFRDESVIEICKNCHKCVDVCPTGALRIL